mgnify:CR=1 FL=1
MKTGAKKNEGFARTLRMFKALSDQMRLRIIMILCEGERCVCEIRHILGVEQSAVSHALKHLKNAGVIISRRDGKWMHYALSASDEVKYLRKLLPADPEIKNKVNRCIRDNIRSACKNGGPVKKEGVK